MQKTVVLFLLLTVVACAKQGATTDFPHNRIIASNGVRDIYQRDIVAEIIVKDQIRREFAGE